MEKTDMEVGTLVRLRGGGPVMTVLGWGVDCWEGQIRCGWFSPTNDQFSEIYVFEAALIVL